jgi:phospholipid/cholesterol/gamma-HCH transport system permease protein
VQKGAPHKVAPFLRSFLPRVTARQQGTAIIKRMSAEPVLHINKSPPQAGINALRYAREWVLGWQRIVHFAALMAVLALSPSSYARQHRPALARHLYQGTAPLLLWFTAFCALVSVVLIRIVVVTALSYGLSQYALEMVVRVLVLELIPLTAALFVALRSTIPGGAELSDMRFRGDFDTLAARGQDPIHTDILPRVLAGVFAVLTLAAVSCVVALVLAYITVYGFTPWGLEGYARTVGKVFHPAVTVILVLKTVFFSLAVSMIPMVACVYDTHTHLQSANARTSDDMQGLVRMFTVLLMIEMASLVGNYY